MRGLLAVVRAPVLVAGVFLSAILVAAPFAIVLGSHLQTAIASRQLTYGVTTDIDAEWWFAFERHAQGLAATFSPAVVGSAAAVSNVSGVLDAQLPLLPLLLAFVTSTAVWAFLWGGILERLQHEKRVGLSGFVAACARRFVPFALLSAIAAAVYLLLYTTLHPVLFGPVAAALQAGAPTEREAFLSRVVLYGAFGTCLFIVSMFVDYARVFIVMRGTSLRESMRTTRQFLAAHARTAVFAQGLICGLVVVWLVGYVLVDVFGGARVGGWRAVALGQVYIGGRVILRLSLASTALAVVKARLASSESVP